MAYNLKVDDLQAGYDLGAFTPKLPQPSKSSSTKQISLQGMLQATAKPLGFEPDSRYRNNQKLIPSMTCLLIFRKKNSPSRLEKIL